MISVPAEKSSKSSPVFIDDNNIISVREKSPKKVVFFLRFWLDFFFLIFNKVFFQLMTEQDHL